MSLILNPKRLWVRISGGPISVRASVIPCDIDGGGGLGEMSFLIDFWPLNTISLEFWQKNHDAEILGWVKNPCFLP
jgi:hypothetical protein